MDEQIEEDLANIILNGKETMMSEKVVKGTLWSMIIDNTTTNG